MDHLADTAWALFESHGYAEVTMEAIAEAADVAKGTLYRYFPVKEALLRHRFHREFAEHVPGILAELAALPGTIARIERFLELNADWSIANREHLAPYLQLRMREAGIPYALDSPDRSGLEAIFAGFVAEGQRSGELRGDLDATAAAEYLEFLYLAALTRWLNGLATDLHAEFRAMLDLYLRGLAR